MSSVEKQFAAIANNPLDVRFKTLERVAVACGFELKRVSGSHHIYQRPDIPEPLNIQNVRGKAKPYQVRQFLALVAKYRLEIL
jgi:hypothetical protein